MGRGGAGRIDSSYLGKMCENFLDAFAMEESFVELSIFFLMK